VSQISYLRSFSHEIAFEIHERLHKLAKKMVPSKWFSHVLEIGAKFIKYGCYEIALEQFFKRILAEKELIEWNWEENEWESINTSCSINASICQFHLKLASDPQITQQLTLTYLMQQVISIQKRISNLFQDSKQDLFASLIFIGISFFSQILTLI
jgi:hypothetical protein